MQDEQDFIRQKLCFLFRLWLRRALLAGAGLFLALSGLDYLVTPENFHHFLILRLSVTGVLAVMFVLSLALDNRSFHYQIAIGSCAVMASAAVVEIMVLRTGGHASSYYFGHILIAICVLGFIPAATAFHLLSGGIIYLAYLLPVMALDRISSPEAFVLANFFLLSSLLMLFLLRHLNFRGLINELKLECQLKRRNEHLEAESRMHAEALRVSLSRYQSLVEAEHALRWNACVDRTVGHISSALIMPGLEWDGICHSVLLHSLMLTGSSHGYVATVNPANGDINSHTLTAMMAGEDWPERVEGRMVIRRGEDGLYPGLWGRSLNTRKPVYSNAPEEAPASGGCQSESMNLRNHIAVPVITGDELVGQIALANAEGVYTERHVEALQRMAGLFALAIMRKKDEDAIKESERRFREFADLMPEVVFETDLDGMLTFVNRNAFDIFGYGREDFEKGFNCLDVIVAEQRHEAQERFRRAVSGERMVPAEYMLERKDGARLPALLYTNCIFRNGKPAGIRGFMVEITDMKLVEERLREKSRLLSGKLKELYCFYRMTEIAGGEFQSEDAILRAMLELIPSILRFEEISSARICMYGRVFEAPGFRETPWVLSAEVIVRGEPAGRIEAVYLEPCSRADESPFLKEERELVNAMALKLGRAIELMRTQDELSRHRESLEHLVDERTRALKEALAGHVRAEEALRESEANYQRLYHEFSVILETVSENIILLSPDFSIQWMNRAAFLDSIEQDCYEVVGRRCHDIWSGRSDPCHDCQTTILAQAGVAGTFTVTRMDGRLFETSVFPIKDDSGATKNVLVVKRDVTERKRLEEAAHMASLGEMAAGIAHEINNPNAFILSAAENLARIWPMVSPVPDRNEDNADGCSPAYGFDAVSLGAIVNGQIESIIEGSRRIRSIIHDMKELARKQELPQAENIDLNLSVRRAVDMLKPSIEKHTRGFALDLDASIPQVMASGGKIEQVVGILLENALQSLPGPDAGVRLATAYDPRLGDVVLSVEDDGTGIDEVSRKSLFKPFFTTKHGGTGIGLSLARRIVTGFGGRIEVDSVPGRGSVFTIRLPGIKSGERISHA